MTHPHDEPEWVEIEGNKKWTFQLGDHPELIHIIKTGFDDLYIVVYEDAYDLHTGKTEFGSKQTIEDKFGIELK